MSQATGEDGSTRPRCGLQRSCCSPCEHEEIDVTRGLCLECLRREVMRLAAGWRRTSGQGLPSDAAEDCAQFVLLEIQVYRARIQAVPAQGRARYLQQCLGNGVARWGLAEARRLSRHLPLDEVGEHALVIVGAVASAAREAEAATIAEVDLQRALMTLTDRERALIENRAEDPENPAEGKRDGAHRNALMRARQRLFRQLEPRSE